MRRFLRGERARIARLEGLGLASAQDDLVVANASGATVRADINSQLQALGTLMSGASAPGTTYAHELWADTTAGVVKKRNAANTGWIVQRSLDETYVLARSSNTMLDVSDIGKTIVATAAFTQTLDAAATLTDGWFCHLRNDSSGNLVLDPNGSETINGATTLNLPPAASCTLVCNGTGFYTIALRAVRAGSFTRDTSLASGSQAVTGVGFKPAKLTVMGVVTAGTLTAKWSLGFITSITAFSVTDYHGWTADNVIVTTTQPIALITDNTPTTYTGSLSSFDSDGFTISWTKSGSPTGTATVYYLAEA